MAYVERTDGELATALAFALSKSLNPDEVAMTCSEGSCTGGKTQYTYRELLEEFRQGSEFGRKYLEKIRECARKSDRDPLDWISHYSK